MIYSTTQNKVKNLIIKTLRAVAVTALWVLVWDIAAILASRNNELMLLLLPRPVTVFEKWLEIAFTSEFLMAVARSLSRIFSGFIIGIVCGTLAGLLTSALKLADWILSPLLKMIRAVPVVAITILFFSLFKSDALPVTIVALMVTPLMWQTVHDGMLRPDKKLCEMAKVYKLSTAKTFYYVRLPQVLPSFITAGVNALGLAWKSGIAAEVICEPSVALGTILMQGKGMIDFSAVYAVTLTVVILSLVIEVLLKGFCRKLEKGEVKND